MGWKILKIDSDCILKTYLNNLQVIYSDSRLLIPINDIDTIILENNRIRLSINLINKLSENNVNIIMCNEKHLPQTVCYQINGNFKTNNVFNKQLKWNQKFKDDCWNWIMKIKCYNQLFLIKDKYDINLWLKKISDSNVNFRTINYESQISNLFFHRIFGNEFNRKDDNNIINKILDYGYTIITSMVCRSIISKGLNQHISFFHGSSISTFPLAYDIVEIFRIVVDFFVIEIYNNKIFDNNKITIRDIKDGFLEYISNIKILIDDKLHYLNNSIDIIMDWIVNQDFLNHKIDIVNVLIGSKI